MARWLPEEALQIAEKKRAACFSKAKEKRENISEDIFFFRVPTNSKKR